MTILSDNSRREEWARFMSDVSRDREAVGNITKSELRSAVDAVDDWLDVHTGSLFNQVLTGPVRAALTAPQKARLLVAVVRRRFEEA